MIGDAIKNKTYTYQNVLKTSLDYFNGDELAATTWINKYCLKDAKEGYLERTPDEMHKRMAKEFGRIETNYIQKESSTTNLSPYGKKRKPLTTDNI